MGVLLNPKNRAIKNIDNGFGIPREQLMWFFERLEAPGPKGHGTPHEF